IDISETRFRARQTSVLLSQRLELPRRIAFNAGIQRLTTILFGSQPRPEWFPSVNVVWWPFARPGYWSTVRLRAAYAEAAGNTQSLLPVTILSAVSPSGTVTRPRMERTNESEIGVDAALGHETAIALTAFRSRAGRLFAPRSIFGALAV